MEEALIIIEDWDHQFDVDSIGATVYSFWQLFMYNSMFKNFIPEDQPDFSKLMTDGYVFTDVFRRMLRALVEDVHDPKHNRFCENGFDGHSYGEAACAYNIARALAEAKLHL